MRKSTIIALGAIMATSNLQAGSFQLNLQGLRQTAMGGSGTAKPWDASTLFFNPAGLSSLDGLQINGGVYFVNPLVRYAAPGTGDYYVDAKRQTSPPFHLYFGGRLNEYSRLGFGIGVYTPFGSSLNWGNDWTGRYLVQDISLKSIFVQPTVSYAISDIVSIGAGFVYGFGDVAINKALPVQDVSGEGQASLSGKANGIGFNAGITIKPNDMIHVGLNYRSGVTMKVSNGTAKFNVPASLAANFPNTNFSTELNLPDIVSLGVAADVTHNVTLQADVIYSTWSRYKSLAFDFEQNTATLQDTDDPRNYDNTLAVRLGANYNVYYGFDIMGGLFYDPTPTQKTLLSPDAVDGNRAGFSAGVAYSPISRLTAYGVFTYTSVARRDASYTPANFSGAYQIKSFTPGIGLSYKF